MSAAITLAAPHERLAALRLLFPDVVELPRAGIETAALFVARDSEGPIRAASLAQALPGALGLIQQSYSALPEEEEALARVACDWLRGRGVKVCQAFAAESEVAGMGALERCGFQRVTRLISLRSVLNFDAEPISLAFIAERPPFSDVFRSTLLATDRETLDCPELNGDRSPEELFASFVQPVDGTTWHLARLRGKPIGVVVLTKGESEDEIELSYLGLVPSARGRGLGRELVTFAVAESRGRGASSLTVSVDSRNNPALQLYRHFGFVEVDCRVVWLTHFSCSTKSPAHTAKD